MARNYSSMQQVVDKRLQSLLHNSTSLNLSIIAIDNILSDRIVQTISNINNQSLYSFNFTSCKLQDENALKISAAMLENTNLNISDLTFTNNCIGTEGIGAIIKISFYQQIDRIDFSGNNLTDENIIFMCDLMANEAKIKNLKLNNNKITDQSCLAIANMITKNDTIKSLNLSSNNITQTGAQIILSAITPDLSITEINLSQTLIPPHIINQINEKLKNKQAQIPNMLFYANKPINPEIAPIIELINNPVTTELDLSDFMLQDDKINLICNKLAYNKYITSVNLANNNITDKSSYSISEMLRQNQNISVLNLSNNALSSVGMKVIADGFSKNMFLTQINLANNQLDDNCIPKLALLFKSKNLKHIDLSNNFFSDRGFAGIYNGIVMCFKHKKNISIDISGNNICQQNISKIISLLDKKNQSLSI